MSAQSNAPVIIKRKKVSGGDGHHGGAWKVAYADFVTAMMAFFMLMWLLNATTEKQRKGIADYFSPTIPINRISGGGDGSFGGNSIFSEDTLSRNGTGASRRVPTSEAQARGDSGVDSKADGGEGKDQLKEVEEALMGRGGESMVSDQALKHIVTRVTDEGLIVELFDLEGDPLFEVGTTEPTKVMRDIAEMLADVFEVTNNEVAINGHMRSHPIVLAVNPVWAQSAGRAGRTRELLERAGLPGKRIQRVAGFADRKPAVGNTMAVRNNRLEIILLRNRL